MPGKKNTILVVDGEPLIRKMTSIFLGLSDFDIEESETGQQAMRMSVSVRPDLILMDLGLPDMDGKEVIAHIRQASQAPIVVTLDRAADEEIAAAIEAGADDYVTKPFDTDVLIGRIEAHLRKASTGDAGEPALVNGSLRMDLVHQDVWHGKKKIPLTPREYELLRFFMINRGRMLTHKQILARIWDAADGGNMQYLEVYVEQLRNKLADEVARQLIITEPGIGYRMEIMKDYEMEQRRAVSR